ncbi:MAG: BON domain-containing protein [Planctomycetaceae bacterium]|nr:BON domain-containing protein [Planctomycetaceae bacterium]
MAVMTAPRQFRSNDSRSRHHADWQATEVAIQEALNRTGHGELRRVGLECEGDTVTISGRVPTFYLKQLVQSIALAALGVERVINQLDVY